jgi:hypothetical protein
MAVEVTFQDLCMCLRHVQEHLTSVYTTITEDRPLDRDSVLVDVFGDRVTDLLGLLEETLAAADDAHAAVADGIDLQRVRRALGVCQDRFNNLAHHYATDLVAYTPLAQLMRFGREHDRECRAWATSVKQGLESCRQPIYEAHQALVRCWQEIAERAGMAALSAQATAVGRPNVVILDKDRAHKPVL